MNKKEKMVAMVEQWRESGMTRKSFANQHGFKYESFNWCKKQYNTVLKVDQPAKTSTQSSRATMPDFVD